MEDTAEKEGRVRENIRLELQTATGQPIMSVIPAEESIPVISGVEEMVEDGVDFAKSAVEDVGKGIVGGGTTKIAHETNSNLKNIVFGRFRKLARNRGGEVVVKKAA